MITLIAKEQLPKVNFTKSEVLSDMPLKIMRTQKLKKALLLGNNDHCKVKITFKTENGSLHQVETTVWSLTDNYLLLKGNLIIPIWSIVELDL